MVRPMVIDMAVLVHTTHCVHRLMATWWLGWLSVRRVKGGRVFHMKDLVAGLRGMTLSWQRGIASAST